ncbi:MAG: heparan-alpha-glucosaminide N-acetyltransferase domain-containing protein [Flavobacteriaceae bacterium]|tara:strand:- start:2440 stop:3624 length:1185 start_codon:yes stop_codon:yes gene_type:complete
MSEVKSNRIESIDILRGVVMVIMALDHVRDFFHYGAFANNPTNLDTTTPILFFTRFITHYCAPVFVFLAGTSAYLYGTKKTKHELFKFLMSRGLWLIFLEIVVNNLLWRFDFTYSRLVLQVIWAIGLSMVFLSLCIFLSRKTIILIGIIIVAGHNLLDSIVMQGSGFKSIIWYILHQANLIPLNNNINLGIYYPVLPWVGLILLGYSLGFLYTKGFDINIRKKWLLKLGFGAIILFFVLRGINIYGDLVPWSIQNTTTKTILSFFKISKYPPSLDFTLITIGPALLFLFGIEKVKNRVTDFFLVFGRVPLFYYFLHIFVIHILAILALFSFGDDWTILILTKDIFASGILATYGYSLLTVYLVWIGVIALLYFPSKKYMIYKANNKDKWWLSYL